MDYGVEGGWMDYGLKVDGWIMGLKMDGWIMELKVDGWIMELKVDGVSNDFIKQLTLLFPYTASNQLSSTQLPLVNLVAKIS